MKNMCAKKLLVGLFLATAGLQAETQGSEPRVPRAEPGARWVVDKIVARVNGANVLKSDLERPQIGKEGEFYSLKEFIGEELLFQRAKEKHTIPSATDIERQIVSFKMQLGMQGPSNEPFEAHLKEYGFTLDTYKKQLGRQLAINGIKQAESSERTVVTAQEVEEYHKQHPAMSPAQYHLQLTIVKGTDLSGVDTSSLEWDDFGFMAQADLHERYHQALALSPGEMTEPIELAPNKYALVKLVAKREEAPRTLAEQYGDIERHLRQEKQQSFVAILQDELQEKAFITFP